ncbi:MAG: transporter substrate-binding domain-containing protein [Hyphomicrobiaceae bacterium]|nr:transporter substrate-binding domain-containing protein [Hyphomicrobiaceae bacterium]
MSVRRFLQVLSAILLALALTVPAGTAHAAGETKAAPGDTNNLPPLRIATIERPPLAMRSGATWVGFSIELWKQIANELGRKTEFVPTATFQEMLKLVEQGRVDAAVANITITADRERVLDFSQPIFDTGLKVMVRAEGSPIGLFGAIFNWEMLGLLVLAGCILFAIANLMWFFERKSQPYFDYPYGEGIWRSFWWALNVMLNGGFEERVPQTRRGRIFAVSLLVLSLFTVSAFVAKITASLTVGHLTARVQSYRDLYSRSVGTTSGSTSAAFLRERAIAFRAYETVEQLIKALETKKVDAVVHDAPILSYYAMRKGLGKVSVVGGLLRHEKYGIALPTGSPLAEQVNRSLLRIRESGAYDRLLKDWFGDAYR